MVEWQTRTLEVRMLTRLAGSTPVLGMENLKVSNGPVRFQTGTDGAFPFRARLAVL